jgi:hypothetical protein
MVKPALGTCGLKKRRQDEAGNKSVNKAAGKDHLCHGSAAAFAVTLLRAKPGVCQGATNGNTA